MINFEKLKEKLQNVKPAEIGQNLGSKAATAMDFAKNLVENEKVKEQAGKVRVVVEEVQKGFLSGWKEVKAQAEKNAQTMTSNPDEQNSPATAAPESQEQSTSAPASKTRTRKAPVKRSAAKKTITKVVVQQNQEASEKQPVKKVRKLSK